MRFATINMGGPRVAVVEGDRVHPLSERMTMRDVVSGGRPRLRRDPGLPLASVSFGPVVPYPNAIYTVGENYRSVDEAARPGPERPLVYGKAVASVGAHGTILGWDRAETANVDPECELAVVIGRPGFRIAVADALDHVFGYTIIDDVSSRDPWLDGDQWLLGKSMPGFCPVGPWIVTRDELDPADLGIGSRLNGAPIQAGRTSQMRSSVAEIVAYISRHVRLRPGDLIATGTPPRLSDPPGPDRHLRPGDEVTCWIEGIGELTTQIV